MKRVSARRARRLYNRGFNIWILSSENVWVLSNCSRSFDFEVNAFKIYLDDSEEFHFYMEGRK